MKKMWLNLLVFLFAVNVQAVSFERKPLLVAQEPNPIDLVGCTDCYNFVAPTVLDANAIGSPEVGLIVYDATNDNFKGRSISNGGNWQNFGHPPGAIIAFGGTAAPDGWLLCDGSSHSVATYSRLHSVIGDSFGGDGGTNFNVPDFRGRFLRGADNGQGRDPDAGSRTSMASGGATGDNVGSVQGDAFSSHTHTQNSHKHLYTGSANGVSLSAASAGDNYRIPWSNGAGIDFNSTSQTATNQNTGGSETRPVNASVNYIIKY